MSRLIALSYSPSDRGWAEQLRRHLRAYRQHAGLTTWDESDIPAGTLAREATRAAFERASAAVLLVSPQFIAEEFEPERELHALVFAVAARGAPVLWIPLSYSGYRNTELRAFTALHDPERPLDGLAPAAVNRAFVSICEAIVASLAAPTNVATPTTAEACFRAAVGLLAHANEAALRGLLIHDHPRGAALHAFSPAAGTPVVELAAWVARCFVVADRLPALWQALRREQPSRAGEIDALAAAYATIERPPATEARPPALDELLADLATQWPGAAGPRALAAALGLSEVLAVADDASPSALLHLILLALCERGDAAALSALARVGGPSARMHELADALAGGRWPGSVDKCWLSVARNDSGGWQVSWYVAGAPTGGPHGRRELRAALAIAVDDRNAAIEVTPTEAGLSLRITGARDSDLVGAAARLWTRVRGLRRRLFPSASDHLGDDGVACLAQFEVGDGDA